MLPPLPPGLNFHQAVLWRQAEAIYQSVPWDEIVEDFTPDPDHHVGMMLRINFDAMIEQIRAYDSQFTPEERKHAADHINKELVWRIICYIKAYDEGARTNQNIFNRSQDPPKEN
jgi:hypothetical protein